MIGFEYARAGTVADAVREMAAVPGAKFVAGGTNLVDLMKMDVERPSRLIDVSRLPLDSVEETTAGGDGTTVSAIQTGLGNRWRHHCRSLTGKAAGCASEPSTQREKPMKKLNI